MWLPRNEAPDNAALQPITFASKNLTSAETPYRNIEREVLGYTSWPTKNVITTAFSMKST